MVFAPLKPKPTKAKSMPWINDHTLSFRRKSRQAECKWKKSKHKVEDEVLLVALAFFQKAAKMKYFSEM